MTAMISLHPVAIFLVGALLAALAGRRYGAVVVVLTPVVSFLNLIMLCDEGRPGTC